MALVQLLEHVELSDGSNVPITATVLVSGCNIQYASAEVLVLWDEINDVEKLSNIFSDYTVRVFKTIVGLLGKVYASKDAYMMIV